MRRSCMANWLILAVYSVSFGGGCVKSSQAESQPYAQVYAAPPHTLVCMLRREGGRLRLWWRGGWSQQHMVKIDGEWAALLADLGDDDDDFPLLSKSIGQIFPFSLSSPILPTVEYCILYGRFFPSSFIHPSIYTTNEPPLLTFL